MSDNKFIKRLQGKPTPKALVEIQKNGLVQPFSNMPFGSDISQSITDDTDSSVIVAKSAQNWTLDGANLVLGNNALFTGEYAANGQGLWVNAAYTFPASQNPGNPVVAIINPYSKFVLRLVGKDLLSPNETIGFTLAVKVGATDIASVDVTVRRQAGYFCKKMIVDFSDSTDAMVKAQGGSQLTLQLLCNDPNASGFIYNGMTVLSLLQRKVDGAAVSNDNYAFDDFPGDIVQIKNEIVTINGQLTTLDDSLQNEITRSTSADAVHTADIATNTQNIATNTSNIAANATAIQAESARAQNAELELSDNIKAVTGTVGYLQTMVLGDETVSDWQDVLTNEAYSQRPDWDPANGGTGVPNAVIIINSTTSNEWVYNTDDSVWVNLGHSNVAPFTNSVDDIGGLAGVIKGDATTPWSVQALTDGTGRVNTVAADATALGITKLYQDLDNANTDGAVSQAAVSAAIGSGVADVRLSNLANDLNQSEQETIKSKLKINNFLPIGMVYPSYDNVLRDGELWCDGQLLPATVYPGLQSMFVDNSIHYVDETAYQADLTANNGCAPNFMYDGANFRTPTIPDGVVIAGASSANTDAVYQPDQFQNHRHRTALGTQAQGGGNINTEFGAANVTASGVILGSAIQSQYPTYTGTLVAAVDSGEPRTGDETRNRRVLKRWKVVVGNVSAPVSQTLYNAMINAVANKADVDLSNLAAAGKTNLLNLIPADWARVQNLTAGWGTTITVTAPSWLYIKSNTDNQGTNSTIVLTINGVQVPSPLIENNAAQGIGALFPIMLATGDTFVVSGGNGVRRYILLVPCRGI